jgi:hypothetical protein
MIAEYFGLFTIGIIAGFAVSAMIWVVGFGISLIYSVTFKQGF